MIKFEIIKGKEGASDWNSHCVVLFMKEKIEMTITGKTLKAQSTAVCFPKEAKTVQIAFQALLKKSVISAIVTEKDPFLIQELETFRNMGVFYWSDYFLATNRDALKTELKERYININEHGITYNERDVRNFN
jgi:hypothetical protein